MAEVPSALPGGCLCGAVRFTVTERPLGVVDCHCSQCRRFHGHTGAYITVPRAAVTMESGDTLVWYRSSAHAERGFCSRCGSSLFWRGDGEPLVDVAAGALDQPTGLTTVRHIHTASKPDYYAITDGAEQFPESAPEPP